MGNHKRRTSHHRFLLVVLDHDTHRYTVEGPVVDDQPWVQEIRKARKAGRDISLKSLDPAFELSLTQYESDLRFTRWPKGTILAPEDDLKKSWSMSGRASHNQGCSKDIAYKVPPEISVTCQVSELRGQLRIHPDIAKAEFQNEKCAYRWLESHRWPVGPVCPYCNAGRDRVAKGKAKKRLGLYHCRNCRKQFSVKGGTIYAGSHVPLRKWLLARHLILNHKKGMSTRQLQQALGIGYKSAGHIAHSIRNDLQGRNSQAGLLQRSDEKQSVNLAAYKAVVGERLFGG